MRIVLDTSALLVSIPRRSPYRVIFDRILDGSLEIAVTQDILLEYEEKLIEKTNGIVSANILEGFANRSNVTLVTVYFNWQLIEKDPDDNKFVDCYVAAQAEYLVSNDRHFQVLSTEDFPPVQVVGIEQFVEILQEK
ncbi:MAG: putative toxin-antitoxin system toxin component, PIN family [Saprospiraceae bacterium]|nr:putative toxin-antitoxin system toxin component, PIN family [Saprospiraceae bacterium]